MNECYRFNQRSMWPAVVPIPYCLLYMLQSGEYIFTPEFITFYKKLDLGETTVMWQMIHHPSKCTLDMILKLIFNARSYSPRDLDKSRYFLIAASNLSSSMSSREYTSQTLRHVDEPQVKSKANTIIESIRKANVVNLGVSQNFEDDYVPLPSDDDTSDNSSEQSNLETLSCPDHIDDMMIIVRKLRCQKFMVIDSTLQSPFSSSSAASVSSNQNPITPEVDKSTVYQEFNLYTFT